VLGVLILLAGAPTASMPLLDARTSRPLDEFGACLTRQLEGDNRAWAYLPSEKGGTFTDSGARGAAASYWLQVRPAATATQLRLFASASAPARADIVEAVRECR
jgi:hypothetical protein